MAETFTFQAEIQQLLDILVHSLYTEREIFLREVVSNASDALNRVQFELLTNRDIQDADAELAVEIKADEEAGTLTISDSGIGMTHDDLVNNLGIIARSGAKAFIEAMKERNAGAATQARYRPTGASGKTPVKTPRRLDDRLKFTRRLLSPSRSITTTTSWSPGGAWRSSRNRTWRSTFSPLRYLRWKVINSAGWCPNSFERLRYRMVCTQ